MSRGFLWSQLHNERVYLTVGGKLGLGIFAIPEYRRASEKSDHHDRIVLEQGQVYPASLIAVIAARGLDPFEDTVGIVTGQVRVLVLASRRDRYLIDLPLAKDN